MSEVEITTILSATEFDQMGQDAVARNFFRNDPRIFVPGTAWFMNWVWDHTGKRQASHRYVMCKKDSAYLSEFYWKDWSDKRPPICVVGPDGDWWEIDRKSKNGAGWIVTGDSPNLTCAPSIVLSGYHGFLREGRFTPDLEKRDPKKIYEERCARAAADRNRM